MEKLQDNDFQKDESSLRDDLTFQISSLQALYDLSTALSHLSELKPSLQAILNTFVEFHHADFGLISLYDEVTDSLQEGASVGLDPAEIEKISHVIPSLEAGGSGASFAARQRVIIEDTENDPQFIRFSKAAREIGFRSVHSTPIFNRSGEILGVISVHFREPHRVPNAREIQFADMCARKASVAVESAKANQALRESEQRFRLAIDAGKVGTWDWDVKTGRVTWSEQIYTFHGLKPGEFDETVEGFMKRIHPEDKKRVEESIRHAMKTLAPYSVEMRVVHPDGKVRWVSTNGRVFADAAGNPNHMVGATVDITETREAQETLFEQARSLSIINNVGKTITAELDLNKLVQAVTDAGREVSGAEFGAFFYRKKNEQGESFVLYTLSGISRESFEKFGIPRNTPLFGPTFRGEGAIRIADVKKDPRYGKLASHHGMPEGHLPVRSYLAVPVTSRSGEVLGGLFFGHPEPDVFTEQAEKMVVGIAAQAAVAIDNASLYDAVQKELKEHKETEESLRESEQRYRVIADDLEERVKERTLQLELQSNRLRVLADQLVATEQKERKRIAAIIHDHLQQLLVAGKFQMAQAVKHAKENHTEKLLQTLSRCDDFLNQAVDASRSLTVELRPPVLYEDGLLAAFQWLAHKFEAEHSLHLMLNLDEVPVAMPDRLKIMLFESVKELLFNVVKHARVSRASLAFRYHRGDSFYLCVEDQGLGFDVKQEVRSSSERGMGLFSIRERLKLINADFKITSDPGRGTRIEIRIPLDAALLKEEKETGSTKRSHHEEPHPRSENAIKILLVDDHKIVREGIANILQERPELHVVAQAENGLDAVEKAGIFLPDVIIMDVNMPKLNGIEATRRIKSEFPHIQIIGLSVLDESGVADSMKKAGAMTLLNKAGDTQELVDTILKSVQSESV